MKKSRLAAALMRSMYAGTHFTDLGRMESWVNLSGKEGHTDIQPSTRSGTEPGTFGLGGRDLNPAPTPPLSTVSSYGAWLPFCWVQGDIFRPPDAFYIQRIRRLALRLHNCNPTSAAAALRPVNIPSDPVHCETTRSPIERQLNHILGNHRRAADLYSLDLRLFGIDPIYCLLVVVVSNVCWSFHDVVDQQSITPHFGVADF